MKELYILFAITVQQLKPQKFHKQEFHQIQK